MSGFGPAAGKDAEYHRHRVNLICMAIRSYRQAMDDPPFCDEQTVLDLLTDLRHYCDWTGSNFEQLNAQAQLHHGIEAGD